MDYDVLILGAGAAGLYCAFSAGQRGLRVLVLESANKPGKKILMSGGGRCNFTNLDVGPANYLSANPHFCKSALARYRPEHFIALVEKHGIAYHEKELGQLFCDDSSKQILQMLLDECAAVAVRIVTEAAAEAFYELSTSKYGSFVARRLLCVLAGCDVAPPPGKKAQDAAVPSAVPSAAEQVTVACPGCVCAVFGGGRAGLVHMWQMQAAVLRQSAWGSRTESSLRFLVDGGKEERAG